MIRIEGTRFGTVEFDEKLTLHFPNGLVGFPNETQFALLEREQGGSIAYLQSLITPSLAFPIIDGQFFGDDYPTPSIQELAEQAGLDSEDLVTFIIVAARPVEPRLVANQLAPIIVDAKNRLCAQVVLDPKLYSAAYPITLQALGEPTQQTETTAKPTTTNEEATSMTQTATVTAGPSPTADAM